MATHGCNYPCRVTDSLRFAIVEQGGVSLWVNPLADFAGIVGKATS